jgi:hypothetical protein
MTELGHPMLHRHHHQAHWEPTPPAGTSTKTTSFSLFYISPYYVKTIYISMKRPLSKKIYISMKSM